MRSRPSNRVSSSSPTSPEPRFVELEWNEDWMRQPSMMVIEPGKTIEVAIYADVTSFHRSPR